MTGHYNRHMYNKLQLPHLSILFTFTGGKHLLADRFVSSRVVRLFQACSASHLSHPLRNSRAYVVCHSPRWSTSARHPMEGARSAMACYWNANWQDNSSFKCIKQSFQCNVVHILVYSFKTVLHKLMPNCLLNEWIKTGESRKRFVPSQIRMFFASHHFGFVFFSLIAVHGKDIFTVNVTVNVTELID